MYIRINKKNNYENIIEINLEFNFDIPFTFS